MVRESTLLRLTRLIGVVSLAALLSAAPFQAALAQTAPPLSATEAFAVLGAATVTNTGPSIVTGNLGVSPGSAITGFNVSANTIVGPGTVTNGPGLVNGIIHAGGATAAQARADAAAAYGNLTRQACTVNFPPIQQIGGLVLGPGVYCFPSSAQITGTLTLVGGPGAVWVFNIGSTLTTATNSAVIMGGAASDTNVFWAVGSSATIGVGTAFLGDIFAVASITLTTRATVSGRAVALNGAVTMDTNIVASVPPAALCVPFIRTLPLATPPAQCKTPNPDDDDDDDDDRRGHGDRHHRHRR
jgi:hypothetical protein